MMISFRRYSALLLAVAVVVLANLGSNVLRLLVPESTNEPTEGRVVDPLYMEQDEISTKEPTENETASTEQPQRNVTVVALEGRGGMARLISRYNEGGNVFCEMIEALRIADPDVVVRFNITFGCQKLFDQAGCGTGNFLGLLYGMRLVAEVYGDVELHFTCHDAEETRNHLILPWLTGVYPARPVTVPSAFPNLTAEEACGGVFQQPLGHMVLKMQQDFRYMAVSLVGQSPGFEDVVSYISSFIPQLSQTNITPPYANVELDEAVIHFRCGDLMDSEHPSFAFMNFHGYVRHIAPNTTSIGILTQPFAKGAVQLRRKDASPQKQYRCRTVVHSLVEYIQKQFPLAQVRIHSEDSIALTYARMILAQQVVVGISTFGVMPAAATFGTGYIRVPDDPMEVNQWVLKPHIDDILDNVVLIDDAKIPVSAIQELWKSEGQQSVLAWFWNDNWTSPT